MPAIWKQPAKQFMRQAAYKVRLQGECKNAPFKALDDKVNDKIVFGTISTRINCIKVV